MDKSSSDFGAVNVPQPELYCGNVTQVNNIFLLEWKEPNQTIILLSELALIARELETATERWATGEAGKRCFCAAYVISAFVAELDTSP